MAVRPPRRHHRDLDIVDVFVELLELGFHSSLLMRLDTSSPRAPGAPRSFRSGEGSRGASSDCFASTAGGAERKAIEHASRTTRDGPSIELSRDLSSRLDDR